MSTVEERFLLQDGSGTRNLPTSHVGTTLDGSGPSLSTPLMKQHLEDVGPRGLVSVSVSLGTCLTVRFICHQGCQWSQLLFQQRCLGRNWLSIAFGIQRYAGKELQKAVRRSRNPLIFPIPQASWDCPKTNQGYRKFLLKPGLRIRCKLLHSLNADIKLCLKECPGLEFHIKYYVLAES